MNTSTERRPRTRNVLPRRRDRLELYRIAAASAVRRSSFNNFFDAMAGTQNTTDPDREKIDRWIIEHSDPSTAAALEFVDTLRAKIIHYREE